MPELTPIKMSAMNEALQLAIGDLFYLGQEDETSDTGYYSRRITAQTVATGVLSSLSLPLLWRKVSRISSFDGCWTLSIFAPTAR